jgi:hypothetical protein
MDFNPDWQAWLLAQTDQLFEEKLGPAITETAKRLAPKRTGALAESIEHHLDGNALVVEAHTDYALYVETGHRQGHEHPVDEPAHPFLRPALYQERGE